MINYLKEVWDIRYFWIHLSLSDLKARWRRSFFGASWSIIQPLGMTLILAFVFSRLLGVDINNYAPYIFSGIIVWEFIITVTIGSATSLINADPYIKQCNHPLAIYTLRTVLTALFILLLASVPLFGWVIVVKPGNFNISWIAILTLYPVVAMIAWPLATFLSYIGTRFRDLAPALSLMMQALWFTSPIYFEEKMFRSGGLGKLIDYNPIYHVLQIIRAPLLKGQWPSIENYLFCFYTAILFAIIAIAVGSKYEKKVIFYL